MTEVGATGDCELVRFTLLGQPINTASTLAFMLAGLWLLRSDRSRWVGWALIATGLGSFAFHGPMPDWGEWAHDVTLSWLIVVVGALGTMRESWSRTPAILALALLYALFPAISDPVAVALAVLVGLSIVVRGPTRAEIMPLLVLGGFAALGRLGATGGPLCDPASPFQPHAMWHIGAAISVAWWATAATGEASQAQRS